jgi:hypothetical protein
VSSSSSAASHRSEGPFGFARVAAEATDLVAVHEVGERLLSHSGASPSADARGLGLMTLLISLACAIPVEFPGHAADRTATQS